MTVTQGSIANVENEDSKVSKKNAIMVRLSPDLLERIDHMVQTRRIPTSRNRWMLEAILEKLDKEEDSVQISN